MTKSEELVKRLRIRTAENKAWTPSDLLYEAAARIAQLEAERDGLKTELANGSFYKESDIDALQDRADAAEAKLREAVEALSDAIDRMAMPDKSLEATLARLTGETQDGGDDE